MSNRYLCHPDGHDDNGGGYDLLGSAGYSDCHSSFGPVANLTGCSITNNGSGKIRIEDEGAFSSDMSGVIVNCTFSDGDATYTCGRYVIIDASSTYIDIDVTYTSATPTVDVRVGGAILSPDEAADLAYGTDGDELVFPANQTTQTINEVDGSANQILCVTEGCMLDAYGVDEDTGELLEFDDTWPVIKAKAGSTWSADTAMLYMQSAVEGDSVETTTIKLDKLILDGNELSPYVVQLGDLSTDYVNLSCGDFEIKNAKGGKSGDGYGLYIVGYTVHGDVISDGCNSLKISNCYHGMHASSRYAFPVYDNLWVDDCYFGIYIGYSIPYYFYYQKNWLITNNTVGLYFARYGVNFQTRITFANNTADIKIDKYGTTLYNYVFHNCLFYNDATSGKILEVDDYTYVTVELENCVYGATGSGGVLGSGITPTLTNCEEIFNDPFVNKDASPPDLRLSRSSAAFDTIWDDESMTNCIGATSPAEPESGGGGLLSGNKRGNKQ